MERQYVAIDLHLHRSVIVRENEAGEKMGVTRIDNDPLALAEAIREAGEHPEVSNRGNLRLVLGRGHAADSWPLTCTSVNPSGLNWGDRRVKNDYRDCCRPVGPGYGLGKLPEAWVAPPEVRELREHLFAAGPAWCACARG